MVIAAGLVLAGCGNETSSDDDGADPGTGRYLPLAVGATWTWRVTASDGTSFDKTSTVEAFEDVGDSKAGIMAYRVRTLGNDGQTVSWQEDTGSAVLRHREQTFTGGIMTADQTFTPYKLRIDEASEHISAGASFTIAYTELETDPATGSTTSQAKDEVWTVEATTEQVTVPAGTFTCLRVRRTGTEVGTAVKTYWFARGVGKVKEVGGQTEELVSFTPGAL